MSENQKPFHTRSTGIIKAELWMELKAKCIVRISDNEPISATYDFLPEDLLAHLKSHGT